MSRLVNDDRTLSAHPTSFDSTNSSYDGIYSTYGIENGYTDSSSTTRAAFYANTGSGAESHVYYNFDCSEIPSGATINSVSCSVKAGTQGTNYYTSASRQVQLYSGTTAKGSASTVTGSNSSPSTYNLSVGTWTAAELQNCKLKFSVTRGSSNTTTNATFSFFGASLTVSYTVSGYMYTITASSDVSGIDASPASQEVFQGGSATVRIDASDLGTAVVKDNNADVTSSLVRHEAEAGGTKSAVLGTYALVSGGFNGQGASYFQGLVGKGEDGSTTSSNYYSSGSGTIAVFTYEFDFSSIPDNATITSVYCHVNGHAESTSNSNEYMCAKLISGSTDISAELNFKSIGTTNSTQILTATTTPTLAQVKALKLQCRLGYYGGAINGATCYVEYTVPATNPYYWTYIMSSLAADHVVLVTTSGGGTQAVYLKVNGSWVQASAVYKKVNGSWVQQSSVTNIFESGVNYRKAD